MFKARTADGCNNISGLRVKELRKALQISQRELSDRLQVVGLDIDKNAVQRIESGERFVTDIVMSLADTPFSPRSCARRSENSFSVIQYHLCDIFYPTLLQFICEQFRN